jgi:hypothetical protein
MTHADSRIRRINLGLAIVTLALLGYYVVQVNAMAAQAWTLTDANNRLSALQDERNSLVAHRASLDDRDTLVGAANQAGLVPAGPVVYLVHDHAVAAR